MEQRGVAFPAFVAEHEERLRGTALLLAADPVDADDLLVAALAGVHRCWRRLDSPAAAVADARAALVAGALGRSGLPARGLVTDLQDEDGDRWLQALAELDPHTRAVTVLRLREALDEDATAALLGCSAAEVGATLAAALDVLNALLPDDPPDETADRPWPEQPPALDHDDLQATHRRPDIPAPQPTPATLAGDVDPYAAYRRPGTPAPQPTTTTLAGDEDPYAAYRRPGTPAPQPTTTTAAGDQDPYAAYRRPGTPAPQPTTTTAAGDHDPSGNHHHITAWVHRPQVGAVVPASDADRENDPDAIYRRPT